LLVLPVGQNLDYDYPVYSSLRNLPPLWGLMLICGLLGVALWAWRKAGARDQGTGISGSGHSPFTIQLSLLSFGLFWFFLTLSVESGVIPIQDVIAEHRLYLPSVGFVLAVTAAAALLSPRLGNRALLVIASVIVVALAGASWKRNQVWRTSESLWLDTAAKSPDKPRVLMALGNLRLERGEGEAAMALYARAIDRDPNYFPAHLNLGILLLQGGMTDRAIAHLQRARDLAPNRANIYYFLGMAYHAKGMVNNSLPFFSRATELAPENSRYRAALQKARGEISPGLDQ
jgi:tetratricopeptide (TPR) repeat protein